MTSPQQPVERLLAVIDVDDTILDTTTALIISEQSANVFKIKIDETADVTATVELSATSCPRPGFISLPVSDEAMILRIMTNALTATSLYLTVAIKDMENVEKALVGLVNDFSVIKFRSTIDYIEREIKWTITNEMEMPTWSLQAVWLNLKPYMDQMQSKNNLTIYPGV
jgi:hypothetical protein